MTRKLTWALSCGIAALVLLLSLPGATSADAPFGPRSFEPDGERISLADLADGETRFFDAGDRQVIAYRAGDRVELTVEEPDGGDRTFDCDLATTDCSIVLPRDGEDRVMILMTRTDGSSDRGRLHATLRRIHEVDHNVFVVGTEGAEEDVILRSEPGGVWLGLSEAGAVPFVRTPAAGGTVLTCPEGDTTMRLESGGADEGPYYCPKHDLELEKATGRVMVREIRVQKPHDDQ